MKNWITVTIFYYVVTVVVVVDVVDDDDDDGDENSKILGMWELSSEKSFFYFRNS